MSSLVTFGETMLRLSPPAGQRLARTDSLALHVGGAESNAAIAAQAFGIEAAWASALPRSPLGERIAYALRGEGVEPLVTWTETGRVGTYYFEPGGQPRGGNVVYDRAGTPVRELTPAALPTDRIREADCVLSSGITPALSAQLEQTTEQFLETASDAGVTTAFDLNYRSKLWSPEEARETVTALFSVVDVLFVAERDARTVLDREGTPVAVARELAEQYNFETVVLTRGAKGAVATHDGVSEQPAFETETVDPVGSGDAFVGAFLAQRLHGESVPVALAYGAATAALNRTMAGDSTVVSPSEVEAVLDGDHELSR